MIRYAMLPVLPALLIAAVGCTPVFPKETLERVDRSITFKQLQGDPEKYRGSWVLFGGVIIGARNVKEGTIIEVLQKPTDSDGRPQDTDETAGRFLVQTDQFLDSAVFHGGRLITVIGDVAGKRAQPIDEIMYEYPVLTARDIHIWRPSTGPRFFFGFGLSGRI